MWSWWNYEITYVELRDVTYVELAGSNPPVLTALELNIVERRHLCWNPPVLTALWRQPATRGSVQDTPS
jgi:hypothetical protein